VAEYSATDFGGVLSTAFWLHLWLRVF